LTDADAEIMDGDVEISGAVDAAGNEQFITMLNDVISIDTRAPQGSVNFSQSLITDADAESTLTISVNCDSPMNMESTPLLVFTDINESESFQATGGQWIDNSNYEFTYVMLDGNIQATAQLIVAGSTDENGNLLNTTNNNDLISIDTENPTLITVTPSVELLSDDDVASGLTLDIVFGEDMNTSVTPQIAYTQDNPLLSSLTENTGENGWISPTTYRAHYTANDAGEELNAIDIVVTGTIDANGNDQSEDLTSSSVFTIDTRNPLVLGMTPSTSIITSSNVGVGTFSIDVEFDEAMNPTSLPAISFSSTPNINFIANNDSQWNSSTDYTAVYDIPNETLQISAVDIALAFGAIDMAGNSAQVYTVSNALSVDVINSVTEQMESSSVSIYPNPTDGSETLMIQWTQAAAQAEILVYNSIGQCVKTYPNTRIDNAMVINVTDYPSGTYYLRLHSTNTEMSLPFYVTH
jgi:hypothetical protein